MVMIIVSRHKKIWTRSCGVFNEIRPRISSAQFTYRTHACGIIFRITASRLSSVPDTCILNWILRTKPQSSHCWNVSYCQTKAGWRMCYLEDCSGGWKSICTTSARWCPYGCETWTIIFSLGVDLMRLMQITYTSNWQWIGWGNDLFGWCLWSTRLQRVTLKAGGYQFWINTLRVRRSKFRKRREQLKQ